MSDVQIELEGGRDSYRPGEELTGSAAWSFDRAPKSVEARLYWRVEGDGDAHIEVARTHVFEKPRPQDRRPFRFVLPRGPYSFEGQLMMLMWGVEIVADRKSAARAEFAMAPSGEPVVLHKEEVEELDDPTPGPEGRSTAQ